MRVLIVDDDPVIGSVMRTALAGTGWLVETETSGQRALDRHAAQPFDVVVTDVFMPGIDGLELVTAFRRGPEPPRVIVMSANPLGGSTDYLALATGLGADAAIAKPFEAAEITRLIALCAGPEAARP